MTFPAPEPGLVIRYSFLWSHEADTGAEEGAKDRPCAIVVAATLGTSGEITVLVAPIPHAPPEADDSIPVPPQVARRLGQDGAPHWLRADELNEFAWPGHDLRPIPRRAGAYAYGMLPRALYEALRSATQTRLARSRPRVQKRD